MSQCLRGKLAKPGIYVEKVSEKCEAGEESPRKDASKHRASQEVEKGRSSRRCAAKYNIYRQGTIRIQEIPESSRVPRKLWGCREQT